MTREEKWELFVCFLDLNDALETYEVHARKDLIETQVADGWVSTFNWGYAPEIEWYVLYTQWAKLERTL